MVTGATLTSGVVRRARGLYGVAVRIPVAGPLIERGATEATALGEQAIETAVALTRSALKVIIGEVITALVEEVDLTELVLNHVDLDKIATEIDLDGIAARIDIDAILGRVDIDGVIETVDLNRAVGGVDIDAIAGRINIDAILARVDLIGLANEVIDGVDLEAIVRQSTTTLTNGVLDDVRVQGAHADDVVAGVFGKLLGRKPAPHNGGRVINGVIDGPSTTSITEVVVDVHRREPDEPPAGKP
ncbi:hypothetical protein [Williamsia sp.]|uniref:hypothetical protein n=1 Tax=Williamsia sp. TaxID=1872085 RepID=UPI002F94187D